MDVWIEVTGAAAVNIEGPIKPMSASVTRALDGVGSIAITVSAVDRRALERLAPESRVSIYIEEEGAIRLMGRGIIKKTDRKASGSGGWNFVMDGPDNTNVLTDSNTFRNLAYNDVSIETVLTDLLFRAGWTASFEGGLLNATARFDGASIFSAVAAVCKQNGIHFRESATVANEMEFGHFGTPIDLRITNPPMSRDAMQSDDIAFITSLVQTLKSDKIANFVVPLGDGQGESALTLEKAVSARSIALGYPYDIETVVENGKTEYVIRDMTSDTNYGTKVKFWSYPEIGVVENDEAAEVASACQLYDAAAADLMRVREPQVVYSVSGVKARKTIRPGDMVWVDYTGEVTDRQGNFIQFVQVDQEFYVLRVVERASTSGITFDLEISNIDAMPKDEIDQIIEATERIELRTLKPGLTSYRDTRADEQFVQQWDGQPSYIKVAAFPLTIDDRVTFIQLVRLHFTSKPLSSTSLTDGVNNFYIVVNSDNYPQDISLFINDEDCTAEFSGPWNAAPGNSPVDVTLNITDKIKAASGGLRQTHMIEFRVAQHTRETRVPGYGGPTPTPTVYGNQGVIRCETIVEGTAQSTLAIV